MRGGRERRKKPNARAAGRLVLLPPPSPSRLPLSLPSSTPLHTPCPLWPSPGWRPPARTRRRAPRRLRRPPPRRRGGAQAADHVQCGEGGVGVRVWASVADETWEREEGCEKTRPTFDTDRREFEKHSHSFAPLPARAPLLYSSSSRAPVQRECTRTSPRRPPKSQHTHTHTHAHRCGRPAVCRFSRAGGHRHRVHPLLRQGVLLLSGETPTSSAAGGRGCTPVPRR